MKNEKNNFIQIKINLNLNEPQNDLDFGNQQQTFE